VNPTPMPSDGGWPDGFEVDPQARCPYTFTITRTSDAEAVAAGTNSGSQVDGTYFNQPGVAVVTWDPTCSAARIEWQGWADPTEFAAASNAIIRALMEHRGSSALGDCQNMRAIQQSDQDWASSDWMPRILAAGLTRMALVIAKSGLAQMNVEDVISKVPGTKLSVAYFATVREASEWLNRPPTTPPVARDAS
jgi:hypothetical protein